MNKKISYESEDDNSLYYVKSQKRGKIELMQQRVDLFRLIDCESLKIHFIQTSFLVPAPIDIKLNFTEDI